MGNTLKTPYLSEKRVFDLIKFQKTFPIHFKDVFLLHRAFIHSSMSQKEDNERLEFVGDSVLGLVVSEELYNKLQGEDEGILAKMKAFLVCEETLAKIGRLYGFDQYLCLGKGEEKTGGRNKKAIIANTVEAVIGAYYIDSGFEKVREFVLSLISSFVSSVIRHEVWYDYKSLLQVMLQKEYKNIPSYALLSVEGPEHDHTFWVQVTAAGNTYGPSCGKSKKEAEQEVAKLAYNDLCKLCDLYKKEYFKE